MAAVARIGHLAKAGLQLGRARRAAPGGVVLAYHDVVGGRRAEGLSVTAAQLRSHIDVLRRLGLTIVTLGELVDAVVAGQSTDGMAALTFDDALSGLYAHGLEVLEAEAAPATVFVVSRTLGVSPPWWAGASRTMTAGQLRDAANYGVAIGSHTRRHVSLPAVPPPVLADELAGSRADLADLIGQQVDVLAYPYGHHDAAVRGAAARAGYRAAFTFLNGRLSGAEAALRLPRLTMVASSSPWRLALQLGRPADSWPAHQADTVVDGGPVLTPAHH